MVGDSRGGSTSESTGADPPSGGSSAGGLRDSGSSARGSGALPVTVVLALDLARAQLGLGGFVPGRLRLEARRSVGLGQRLAGLDVRVVGLLLLVVQDPVAVVAFLH